MRALHHTMMGVGMFAVLAISVVAIQPWIAAAEAQHSHASGAQDDHATEAQDHFHALVGQLDLTEDQQHSLAEPFQEAFAAMQKLHQLHEVIATELTDEQKNKLAQMIHEMLGASFAEQMHGHDAPHEAHH